MAKPDPDFVSAKDDVDIATTNAPNIRPSRLDGMTDIRYAALGELTTLAP
jgi:hypothetical protein